MNWLCYTGLSWFIMVYHGLSWFIITFRTEWPYYGYTRYSTMFSHIDVGMDQVMRERTAESGSTQLGGEEMRGADESWDLMII